MNSGSFSVQPLEQRLEGYRQFERMRSQGKTQDQIIRVLGESFNVKGPTVRRWLDGDSPYGRNLGRVLIVPELFYVLGALLGDGSIYLWRHSYQVWLYGEQRFAERYAKALSRCLPEHRYVPFYNRRNVRVSFVKIQNAELFLLVRKSRADPSSIVGLLEEGDPRTNARAFVQGFFDAEGCVKVTKDKSRTIHKICLDITNTDLTLVETTGTMLKSWFGIETKLTCQRDPRPNRRAVYHLRIYKKSDVRRFLALAPTIKMTPRKAWLTSRWLEKENWKRKSQSTVLLPC